MNCSSCRDQLSRYLDQRRDDARRSSPGEEPERMRPLPPDQVAELEAHIQACGDCAALLATMAQVGRALRQLEPAIPPADLAARAARAALASGKQKQGFLDRLIPVAWPAAAMAVAVAVALFFLPGSPPPPRDTLGEIDPVGNLTALPDELTNPTLALVGGGEEE